MSQITRGYFVFALMFATICALLYFAFCMAGHNEQLAAQCQQLKHVNAAVKRAQTLPLGGDINSDAILDATYVWPLPPTLLAAIRLQENGGEGLELGNHGKTEFICNTFPIEEWQYAEAARTSTKFAWEFCLSPKHRKYFMEYLAYRYTGPPARKFLSWAKSVDKLEKRMSERGKPRTKKAEVRGESPRGRSN